MQLCRKDTVDRKLESLRVALDGAHARLALGQPGRERATVLARLVPGATVGQPEGRGLNANGWFTANGTRPAQNNYMLDGIDNNTLNPNCGAESAIEAGLVEVERRLLASGRHLLPRRAWSLSMA